MSHQFAARSLPQSHSHTRHGGTGGWFLVLVICAGAFAAIVLFPDQIRNAVNIEDNSISGNQPVITERPRIDPTAAPQTDIDTPNIPLGFERLADQNRPAPTAAPEIKPTVAPQQVDNGQARELLTRARESYENFDWGNAKGLARQVTQLSGIDPAVQRRAQLIIDTAPRLEDMFSKLNERGELQRSFDTHPLQVTITNRGRSMEVIPVLGIDSKIIPDTNDPVQWIQGELKNRQRVAVLMANTGAATELEKQFISSVVPFNVAGLIGDRQKEFDNRMGRLKASDLTKDPLAWYEAAKFAYQNRLDSHVTALLERALYLNPLLAQAIRNDKAQDVYLKMADSITKGNRAAAANWKLKLDQYKDATIYEEALAYYKGNLDELRQARQAAAEKAKQEALAVREARRQRAEDTGDNEALAQLQQEEVEIVEQPTAQPSNADVAKAQEYMDQALEIYREAQSMPAVMARDNKYKEAGKLFTKARDGFFDQGMEAEGVRANQLRYACMKYRRF